MESEVLLDGKVPLRPKVWNLTKPILIFLSPYLGTYSSTRTYYLK